MITLSKCKLLYRHLKITCTCFSTRLSTTVPLKPTKLILIGLVPVFPYVAAQSELVNVSNKAVESEVNENENTKGDEGWERVCAMFRKDEYGGLHKKMIAVLQSTSMACFIGMICGGMGRGKDAYREFMDRNQATAFENIMDARRKMQYHMTMNFAKGAWYWSWRLSVFTGGFMLFLTAMSEYRGKSSFVDYVFSGTLVGALLRCRHGPQFMVVGGTVGGVLGLFCGLMTTSLLSMTGTDLDEVLALQYELRQSRTNLFDENFKKGQQYLALKENKETRDLLEFRDPEKEKYTSLADLDAK